MVTFIIYLAKASGLTVLFYLAYTSLLKKETFFTLNRMFLLAGLFTSALLPLIVYTKIILVTPRPAAAIPVQQINTGNILVSVPQVAITPESFTISWLYVAGITYCAGLLFFTVHFLIDLYKVKKMLSGKKVIQQDGFKYIDSDAVQSPFSFFSYIVYNAALLQPPELDNIIAHEKVHSSQKHSLDVLLSQLFCIVFWFNPFAWLYRKTISQNLEFIADAVAAKQVIDIKAYQITLLKITVQSNRLAITNHFYQSLIKKRIVMLNKQQSKRHNLYKYALIIPALIVFILLYQIEVVAQEKESKEQNATTTYTGIQKISKWKIVEDITKDTKDEELKNIPTLFKKEFDADVIFTNVKRNAKGEITTIKVTVKDKDHQANYPVYEISADGNTPITAFTIDIEQDDKTGKNIINFGKTKIKSIKIIVPENDTTTQTTSNSSVKTQAYRPEEEVSYLYIVDGIPKKEGEDAFKELDPNIIDKIEILKNDSKIVTLYGERAKKGVILITTKKKNNNNTFRKPQGEVSNEWFDAKPDPNDMKISTTVSSKTIQRTYTIIQQGKLEDSIPAFKAGVKFSAYSNDNSDDAGLYSYYKTSATHKNGEFTLKRYAEMTANEIDEAYKEQEILLKKIEKQIKIYKDLKDTQGLQRCEGLKSSIQKTLKELKAAKKDLKRKS